MSELADRLVDAAVMASEDCGCGSGESRIVVAVLRVLEEVSPGTPQYAVEFTHGELADEIEGRSGG